MKTQISSRMRAPLALAALGFVFGDIGTSPLYAFREAFSPARGLALTSFNVHALLSLIFWAITLVVSVKYVVILLRQDHRGEGGVLALLSIAGAAVRDRPRLAGIVGLLGVAAAALFYGDALMMPAITVLAALEAVVLVHPGFEPWVLAVATVALTGLFLLQRGGRGLALSFFGPIMALWFAALGGVGLLSIVQTPEILWSLDPRYAWALARDHPDLAFIALGAVILCVTGAEVLYTDLGRCSAGSIRLAWFFWVLPSLMLNYLGQGALVLRDPQAIENPFFLLVSPDWRMAWVLLATLAALIACQAVISGVFAATQQASRMNYLPRLRARYVPDAFGGRIYIPLVNGLMALGVLTLVLGFRSSAELAQAYGLALSGTLVLGSVLLAIVLIASPARRQWLWLPVLLGVWVLEWSLVAGNLWKLPQGAWYSLSAGLAMFTVLTTWRRGMEILRARKQSRPQRMLREAGPLNLAGVPVVPGAAVFFSSTRGGYPASFLHNLRHNKIRHEKTVFLTVEFDELPRIPDEARIEIDRRDPDLVRVVAHVGFREDPDAVGILRSACRKGLDLEPESVSWFVSKPVIVSVTRRGPFGWRRSLFGWMLRNSPGVASYFKLPPSQVIELGAQVGI